MVLHRAIAACSLLAGCGPVVANPSADTDDGTTTAATLHPPLDTATSTPSPSEPGTSMGSAPGTGSSTSDDTSDDTTRGTTVNDTFDPDGGSGDGECDLWSQDCPDGEKCNAWANDGGDRWNAAVCFPVDPNPVQLGGECVVEGSPTGGHDNCDHGLMCFDADPATNVGTCVALCGGNEVNPICNDDTTTCTISNNGVLILCLPKCDPIAQDCAADHSCMPTYDSSGFVCFPTYSPSAAAGEPCEFPDSCVAGTVCMPADLLVGCGDMGSCCTPFCDHAAPDPDLGCPAHDEGEICNSWFDENGLPGRPPLPIGVCTNGEAP